MSQFKAGDIVVCIDSEGYEEILNVGEEYIVHQIHTVEGYVSNHYFIRLKDIEPQTDLSVQRFVLKQNKPEETPMQNLNTSPNPALLPLAAIQHYTANNQNLLFSVEDGKLVVTNIEKDQRCVVESLEEAVKALTLLDNISKSYKEWDEFYKEKEHV